MYEDGMEIGSHTVSHIDARYNNNETILKQYKESKEFLESIIGDKIEHFCYPYGGVTEYAKKALREVGYKLQFEQHMEKLTILRDYMI